MLNHQIIGNTKSNTLIVFLHEGLGCIEMWKSFPLKVCQLINAKGLVYDRAGYGQSQGDLTNRKANYLHLAVDELYQLLKQLNLLNHQIILYGHSDGGSIALLFTSKHPHLVKVMITEAAHVFVEQETLDGIAPAVEAFKEGKLKGLKKYHGENYKKVFYAWVNIWNHTSFRNWNIEQDISKIICPQLIIQGKNDQYGTINQVKSIEQNTKGKSYTFTPENCGHAPFKELENDVLKTVKHFFSSII